MAFATPEHGDRVSSNTTPMPSSTPTSPRLESKWLSWGRSVLATTIALVLIALGIANIAMRARWQEVEDGVFWDARAEGVTAVEVASGSTGALAGVARGDILLAVNGQAVQTRADVTDVQHRARVGTELTYTRPRLGK